MAQPAKAQVSAHQPANDLPAPGAPLPRLPGEEPPLMLALDDLVRDQDGEVVLFNDSGLRALALSTTTVVVEEGLAGRHVTAAGEDVSGFRYLAFANGLRLYYQPGLDLIILDETVQAD
jgi:hypothetical protein